MNTKAKNKLIHFQKDLYERAYKDALSLASGTSKRLLAYAHQFEKELPSKYTHTDLEKIIQHLKKTDFLLYGDFHTLKQSQRGLLRILRALVKNSQQRRNITLALEAFKGEDQQHLDDFLNGTIKEGTFLKRTHYFENWGFPWPNYKMLLDYARDYNIRVIGINSQNAGQDRIDSRDSYAAKILVKEHQKNPDHLIICMIGEHHLAATHLPQQIQNSAQQYELRPQITKILTNIDQYFFKLFHDKPSMSTEYLELKKGVYCIMNSPPWVKWQSYTTWEELRGIDSDINFQDDMGIEEEFELYTEQTYDLDYHFLSIVKSLAKFIGAQVNENDLSSFSIYTTMYSNELDLIDFPKDNRTSDIKTILERVNEDGVYFLSDPNTILITQPSINNLSEAAGQFLHKTLVNFTDRKGDEVEQFYRRIIKITIAMVSSKILNPRRKCMTLEHHKKLVKKTHRKRLIGHSRLKREASKHVIKHFEWMEGRIKNHNSSFGHPIKSISLRDTKLNFEVSRSIGLILGYKLYRQVMSNQIPSSKIKSLFTTKINSYEDLWKLIVSLHKEP